MPHALTQALFDPRNYEAQIEILHDKYRSTSAQSSMKQQGVELSAIRLEAASFSRALVKDIKAGRYALHPARLLEIEVSNKIRVIYQFRLSDLIVHGAVSHLIHEACIPNFSPNLHSYLKGRNWWAPIQDFSRYARRYRERVKNPRERDLFVLRRDISSYTDSIPVGVNSPLWPLLTKELKFPEKPRGADLIVWKLIENVVRAEAFTLNGRGHFTTLVGVPTGSPISTTMFNVYLVELDRAVDAQAPAFYARYGDDLCVADPDAEKVRRIDELIVRVLQDHRLSSNAKKSQNLAFNGAGRPSPAWPEARGAHQFTFLGCDISAKGTTSLSHKNQRALLNDLTSRLRTLGKHLPKSLSTEDRMKIGCKTVNDALDADHSLAHKTAPLLRHVVTDRPTLKDLDRQIAQMILKFTTGSPSVKAFRDVSYRKLRTQGRLVSLYHRRNQVGKKR